MDRTWAEVWTDLRRETHQLTGELLGVLVERKVWAGDWARWELVGLVGYMRMARQ